MYQAIFESVNSHYNALNILIQKILLFKKIHYRKIITIKQTKVEKKKLKFN